MNCQAGVPLLPLTLRDKASGGGIHTGESRYPGKHVFPGFRIKSGMDSSIISCQAENITCHAGVPILPLTNRDEASGGGVEALEKSLPK
jgi:hypothetical protein